MQFLTLVLKQVWLDMLEPPWRHSGPDDERSNHWFVWLVGWAWTIAGLGLGAVLAPSLMQFAGLSNTYYQDAVVIGVAVLAGFLVQLLGWCVTGIVAVAIRRLPVVRVPIIQVRTPLDLAKFGLGWLVGGLMLLVAGLVIVVWVAALLVPLVGVGYGINRYFTLVGPGQGTVTVAFVGGLLVKTFVIPAVWGAIRSRAFKALMDWLRGGKDTKDTKSV